MPKVIEGANALNWMGFSAPKFLEHSPTDFKSLIIRNILMDAGLERENTQDNLPQPSITVVDNHESAKLAKSSKKRCKWLKCLKYKDDWIEETRGALMVVATVITTITFQPAISPPGGVWQTNVNDTSQGFNCSPDTICEAGTSVAGSDNIFNYRIFLLFNSSSFIASLCFVFLLISGFPLKNKICMGLLTFAMCTTITFLALAYFFAVHLVYPSNHRYGSSASVTVMPTYGFLTIMAVVLLIPTVRFVAWAVKETRKQHKVVQVGQT